MFFFDKHALPNIWKKLFMGDNILCVQADTGRKLFLIKQINISDEIQQIDYQVKNYFSYTPKFSDSCLCKQVSFVFVDNTLSELMWALKHVMGKIQRSKCFIFSSMYK